MTRTTCYICL